MAMKTINVSEATELQLDWLVAKCKGLKLHRNALLGGQIKEGWWVSGYYMDPNNWIPLSLLNFSTNWSQGGPLKERQGISSGPAAGGGFWAGKCPINDGETLGMEGPTELIAIARCYVASVMGETIEVPEELL